LYHREGKPSQAGSGDFQSWFFDPDDFDSRKCLPVIAPWHFSNMISGKYDKIAVAQFYRDLAIG
jgi:hypothetical protein